MSISEVGVIATLVLSIFGIFAKIVHNNTSSNVKLESAISNLQITIVEMKSSHEKDFDGLKGVVDSHTKELSNHDKRISVIESKERED